MDSEGENSFLAVSLAGQTTLYVCELRVNESHTSESKVKCSEEERHVCVCVCGCMSVRVREFLFLWPVLHMLFVIDIY